jgi:hypothetical protein
MAKIKVNVVPGVCAICGTIGDTVQVDCHVEYKGEWVNQLEMICPSHVAAKVKKEKVEPEKKVVVKEEKKVEKKPDSVFYAGKHFKK